MVITKEQKIALVHNIEKHHETVGQSRAVYRAMASRKLLGKKMESTDEDATTSLAGENTTSTDHHEPALERTLMGCTGPPVTDPPEQDGAFHQRPLSMS